MTRLRRTCGILMSLCEKRFRSLAKPRIRMRLAARARHVVPLHWPAGIFTQTLAFAVLAAVILFVPGRAGGQRPIPVPADYRDAEPSGLPLPSSLPLADYEAKLYEFLFERKYTKLKWAADRRVRDTGPYVLGSNYGTHPAVRIYYSPGIINWLVNHREGEIPDGAMIIKEMFNPPAARYEELQDSIDAQFPDNPVEAEKQYEATLQGMLSAWTVLVKDKSVSKDGWFWAGPAPGSGPDTYDYPFNFPTSGVGLGTCLRCHSSATSEVTFSSLTNIHGFEKYGEPLQFRVDNSWRTGLSPFQRPAAGETEPDLIANLFQHLPEALRHGQPVTSPPLSGPNPAFLSTFSPVQAGPDGKPLRRWIDMVAEGATDPFPREVPVLVIGIHAVPTVEPIDHAFLLLPLLLFGQRVR